MRARSYIWTAVAGLDTGIALTALMISVRHAGGSGSNNSALAAKSTSCGTLLNMPAMIERSIFVPTELATVGSAAQLPRFVFVDGAGVQALVDPMPRML